MLYSLIYGNQTCMSTANSCFSSFAADRLGWAETKVNEALLPVLKRMNTALCLQTKVTYFLPSCGSAPPQQATPIKSRRIRAAVTRIKG